MNQLLQTWHILHIDDDEDDHFIVRAMLGEARGRKVSLEWAPTLEIGRQKLSQHVYQAVLVDYDLGVGTGIELIREAVQQGYPSPLILLTGRGSYEVDMEAMYAGATLYLTKSEINPLLLERSIRYAIERKQFEQDLLRLQQENHRQKELLERVIRSAPVAIAFVKGPQHVFELVNEQYMLIARGKGQVIGRSMAEVWSEVADVIVPQLDAVYQTGERFSIDNAPFTLLRGDTPEETTFTYTFLPLYQADGSIEGILNLAIETTTAVRERQLAQAQTERLEAVLQALPVGVWITNAQGNILRKNLQADRIWAGDARLVDDIQQYAAYQAWDPETGQRLAPEDYPLARTVRTGEPAGPQELRIQRFDGSQGYVLVSSEPIRDPDGCMVGAVAVNLDVTERKRAEQSLRDQEALRQEDENRLRESEQRYRQLAGRLQEYTGQLERSNRELQEFAYVASHDLQAPLRKVSAFGSALFHSLQDRLTPSQRDQFERMLRSAGRMQETIQDLLELAQITTQGGAFAPVDLQQLAQQVVTRLAEPLAQANGQVTVGDLPTLQADGRQMESLLLNLIGNAIKYHPDGRPPRVELRGRILQQDGRQMAEIQVVDNGIGFEMEHAGQIFQPFHRLHGQDRYEGTGIGLAICRRIVERHAGTITATSTPGQGSTFTVLLPLAH